jgi:hypothetical protein
VEENQIQQELSSIRNMMERSSKFISLSGLSGILAGVYALIGSAAVYYILHKSTSTDLISGILDALENIKYIICIGLAVLLASLITGFVLTYRKAKRKGQSIWGKASRALLFNMSIPILAGGALVVILLYQGGNLGLLLPTTMIFYGLALVNASNFTFTDVKYLGVCEIILGLIGACIPGYGLILWAVGFGLLHIIYGSVMYLKYDRESTI